MNNTEIKTRENKARRQLKAQGLILEKRRGNDPSPYHSGSYRVLDGYTGDIVVGENFDMHIEEIEAFISK